MALAAKIALTLVVLVALIYLARSLDRRWRERFPEEKPFVWGYFQALCFFPTALYALIWLALSDATSWLVWLIFAVYGVAGPVAGYVLIVQKRRWAWLFVMLAQLNLLTLTIDLLYSQTRWREFR